MPDFHEIINLHVNDKIDCLILTYNYCSMQINDLKYRLIECSCLIVYFLFAGKKSRKNQATNCKYPQHQTSSRKGVPAVTIAVVSIYKQ